MLLAVGLPLWVLVSASALQLWPSLRGETLFDPFAGQAVFVEYGLLVQWFRGGAVATLAFALASPALAAVGLAFTGLDAWGRSRSAADAARFEAVAGPVEFDAPILVRKRRKGARTRAIPVRVVEASALRRGLAKGVDAALLGAAGAAGAAFGVFGTAGTLDWGALALGWPALGAAVAMTLVGLAQGSAMVDRGKTLGKVAMGLRVVPLRADRPPGLAAVLRRELLPAALGFAVAALAAVGAGLLAVELVRGGSVPGLVLSTPGGVDRVDYAVLPWAVGLVGFPVLWAALAVARGLPLVWGGDALHDRLAGTRVVRTALGQLPSEDADAPSAG